MEGQTTSYVVGSRKESMATVSNMTEVLKKNTDLTYIAPTVLCVIFAIPMMIFFVLWFKKRKDENHRGTCKSCFK